MAEVVKPGSRRHYSSSRRRETAEATRQRVLAAARLLFCENGYVATNVADIARHAEVAVDTIYATVGRKPTLMREVLESAISGVDHAVPAHERDYVINIRAASGAAEKIAIYAAAVTEIGTRMAPIHRALREAALTDAELAALRDEIAQRRAANMLQFAADLRATGELRDDLSDRDVADIVWSTNDAEYFDLLVRQRGWAPVRFNSWLTDLWTRTLLD